VGLPALRQVSIAATGLLPRRPVPLLYDARKPDPWDEQFLGDAIELGGFLDTESRGFTSQLGPRASVDAPLLQRVLPPLARESAVAAAIDAVKPSAGEALVGAAIVVESGGPFAQRWSDVFSFRDAGAQWGLVALDQKVKRDALKSRLRDALGRSPLLFATGPRRPTTGGTTSTTSPAASTPTTRPGGGATTTTPPPTTPVPTPTLPPVTVPPPTIPQIRSDPAILGDQSPSDPGPASPTQPPSVVQDLVDLVGNLTSPTTTIP